MALLICPECGKKVSEYASACPECGCPINIIKSKQMQQQPAEKPIEKLSDLVQNPDVRANSENITESKLRDWYSAADQYLRQKQYDEAIPYLRKAAECGYTLSLHDALPICRTRFGVVLRIRTRCGT